MKSVISSCFPNFHSNVCRSLSLLRGEVFLNLKRRASSADQLSTCGFVLKGHSLAILWQKNLDVYHIDLYRLNSLISWLNLRYSISPLGLWQSFCCRFTNPMIFVLPNCVHPHTEPRENRPHMRTIQPKHDRSSNRKSALCSARAWASRWVHSWVAAWAPAESACTAPHHRESKYALMVCSCEQNGFLIEKTDD